MALTSVVWRLASPYDAFVSHVAQLENAIERINQLSEMAMGYEAGLRSSVRMVPALADAEARAATFREQLASAASEMTDEEFEQFIADLGGGHVADVESDRAKAASRMSAATRGLEEYFGIAGHELTVLEKRGYDPGRREVARQLEQNGLPQRDLGEYRALLHDLGRRVGRKVGTGRN